MNALVVGGSSGIGLSIVLQLAQDDEIEYVYVIDKAEFPSKYNNLKIIWLFCELSLCDYSILNELEDIQSLYITAGFGHLKWFHYLTEKVILIVQ